MAQSSSVNAKVTAVDAMILSFGQLLQPTDADEIYSFAKETFVVQAFSKQKFQIRFKWLERSKLFWRTADHKYVVTPAGESFALTSLNAHKRDKLRLLILNKKRYAK